MPTRPMPREPAALWNQILERIRALERYGTAPIPLVEPSEDDLPAYTWQSPVTLSTGYGHRLHADRAGVIAWCRVERSAGDGAGTALCDVEVNDTPIFITAALPSLAPSTRLGGEAVPDTLAFAKGDSFRIHVLETGGGTGPLRVTIRYRSS